MEEERRNLAAQWASPHRNRISRLVAEVDRQRKEGQELAVRLDERAKVQKMSMDDLERYLGDKSDIVVQFRKLQQVKNSLGGKTVAELGESLIESAREVQASAVEAAIVNEIEKDEMRQIILDQEKILANTVQEMKLSLRLVDHQAKAQGMGTAANAWAAGQASALDRIAQGSSLIDTRLLPRSSDPSNFLRSLHSTFPPGSPQYLTGQTGVISSHAEPEGGGAGVAYESRRRSKSASPTRHYHSTANIYPQASSPYQVHDEDTHRGTWGDIGYSSVESITRTARDVTSQVS